MLKAAVASVPPEDQRTNMLPVSGGWTRPLLGAVAALCNYSTAACEAVVAISDCGEVLLETALAFTDSVSLSLAAMLRLNAFLRLALAGVLFSREDRDRRRRSSCATRPRAFGESGCSPLCWGEAASAQLGSVRSALWVVHALGRCARSVCAALVHVVPSLLRVAGLWTGLCELLS